MKRFRRIVLAIVAIVFAFSVGLPMYSKMMAFNIPLVVHAGSDNKPVTDSEYDKIHQWITDHMAHPEKIKDKHVKKVKKISDEEGFYYVWSDYVKKNIALYSDTYYYDGRDKRFIEIYNRVWPDSNYRNKIDAIEKCVDAMDSDYAEIRRIRASYPFERASKIESGTFMVTQRLEKTYTDNLLGKLEKEYDSYQPVDTSDWVAYDFIDNCVVIHADYTNPFSKLGNYNFYYVVTNETMELTDDRGFVDTVPVYFLIPDEVQGKKDLTSLNSSLDDYNSNLKKMKELLGVENKSSDAKNSSSSQSTTTAKAETQKSTSSQTQNNSSGTSTNSYSSSNTSTNDAYLEGDPGDSDEYIIWGSDSGYVEKSYLESLSDDDLRLARNEILARHGRKFKDPELQGYFDSMLWYTPRYEPEEFDAKMDQLLNDWEKANVNLIKEVEAKRK